MGPGEAIVLFDGSGTEYPSTITEATTRNVTVRIEEARPGTSESHIHISVGIGLLKANKMDLVIQKMSELGVQEIFPFASCRTVPAFDPHRAEQRRERWQTIAREASRQSGRSKVAEVRPVHAFEEALLKPWHADVCLLFTTEAALSLDTLAREQARRPARASLLIGPEGGFSPEEQRTAQRKGFVPVGLGPRVLRAETAAILAVGLVQYVFGDLGGCPPEGDTTDP
jgi:16S rRNA (uracil1498-N3)-methyltransferase